MVINFQFDNPTLTNVSYDDYSWANKVEKISGFPTISNFESNTFLKSKLHNEG